jgi:hypothetical protein
MKRMTLRRIGAALAWVLVFLVVPHAEARAAAYVHGKLDGLLADHLLAVLQPVKWRGETNGPVLLAGKNARKLDGAQLKRLLAVYAAGQPIVLTNATKEHVKALMNKLGQPVPVELRPPYDHFDYYAYANSAFGSKVFTMLPPIPVTSQQLTPLGKETDLEKLQRAQELVQWIKLDVQQSVQTGGKPSGAQGTGSEILDIVAGVKAWEVKTQYPVTYYWGSCGFETNCTNNYQVYFDAWPVYSASNDTPGGTQPTDFFVTQLSANLNASGCWDAYQKYSGGTLDNQDQISAFWVRQYQFTASVPQAPPWTASDLAVDPQSYNPQTSDPNVSVQEGTTWSIGGSGTVGPGATAVGFSASATFSTSTTYQYQALKTIANVGGSDSTQASWTYDAWDFVRSAFDNHNCSLPDLAGASLEADVITDATFSPTMTYVWNASKNVRQAYNSGTLPVTYDLGVQLGWAYYPVDSTCTGGGSDETPYPVQSASLESFNALRVNNTDTSALIYAAGCSPQSLLNYGTVPLGPTSNQDWDNGNPGTPYTLPLSVNVPFAPTVAPPALDSVLPNSGKQGTQVKAVLTGEAFQPGATCSFGKGITAVGGCTYDSPTQLEADLLISKDASVGPSNITVTNPDGNSSALVGGFTITPK